MCDTCGKKRGTKCETPGCTNREHFFALCSTCRARTPTAAEIAQNKAMWQEKAKSADPAIRALAYIELEGHRQRANGKIPGTPGSGR